MTGQIGETAARVFAGPATSLWQRIEDAGFPLAVQSGTLEVLHVAGRMTLSPPHSRAPCWLCRLFPLRGGTQEILRGIIARGPGLR